MTVHTRLTQDTQRDEVSHLDRLLRRRPVRD
ncbi:integrase [Streptomyces sp. NPDC005963]